MGEHRAAESDGGSRQDERVFDHGDRDASLVELSSQQTVGAADGSHCSWCFAVRVQHPANIFFQTDAVVHALLNLAGRVAMVL